MGGITINGRAADADDDVTRYDWAKFSIRIAVAVIIFAQVAFLAWSLSKTWFQQDSFVMLYRTTAEGGFRFPGSLFTVWAGHLYPGVMGVFWILRSLFDMAWWPFVVVIAGAQVVASCLTWWVLRSFFRARPIAVLLLLIYCASVLTFDASISSAMAYLPLQIAFPATILILQRYLKRPSLVTAVGIVIPSFVAALFFEKALMIVPFVIVLCALTPLTKNAASSWTSRLREARKPLIAMTVMAIAYGIFYTISTRGSAERPNFTLELLSSLDLAPFTKNLSPSLFGGPNRFFGTISMTTDLEVFISLFLFAGLFAWSVIRRRTSIKYWILFAAMIIANLALIALANRTYSQLLPRYMSDLVFPMVLLIGLAVIGNSNDPFERSLPSPPKIFRFPAFARLALVTAVGVVIAVHSVTSQTTLKRSIWPAPGKDYVETARRTARTLTETPTVIEQSAPPEVLNGIFHPGSTTKTVLLPADLNIRFGRVVENPFMVLADGSVVPAKFDLVSQPVATGTPCLNQPYVNKTTLTMNNSPFLWSWYGRVKYTATSKATLSIVWSGRKVVIEIKPGSHTVFFPISGGGQTLTFSVSNGGACIQEIEFLKMVDSE